MKKDKIELMGEKIIKMCRKENFTAKEFSQLFKEMGDWWKTVEKRIEKTEKKYKRAK